MGNAGTTSRPTPVAPILIAMVAGALLGWLIGPDARLGPFDPVRFFEFLGTLFINLLKMLIVPLISSSIITSVAALGSGRDLGRLGLKTLSFYVITTLIAVLIALAIINVVQPGIVNGAPAQHLLALEANAGEVTSAVKDRASSSVFDTLLNIVPANIVEAAAGTKLLGLVFFSVLFGYFLARIESPYRETVTHFWQGVFRVMMRMTEFVMYLAPIGVFALTARVVAKAGISAAGPILVFGACVVTGLVVYVALALPALDSAGGARAAVAAVPCNDAGAAHRVLHRVFVSDVASQHGVRREASEGVRAHRWIRDAARCFGESRGQRAVRMRGGDVHLSGVWAASFVRHSVHGRHSRAHHIDGYRRHSGCIARRHRRDFVGGRLAHRSDRCVARARSHSRHGSHGGECVRGRGVRGDRGASRR